MSDWGTLAIFAIIFMLSGAAIALGVTAIVLNKTTNSGT